MTASKQDWQKTLTVNNQNYQYYSLQDCPYLDAQTLAQLPYSLKVLLENSLRSLDHDTVTLDDIKALSDWVKNGSSAHEIAYHPARVLMQDFTGVPAVVDLAAMRDAIVKLGGDANQINPLTPVDLVIDHSVQVDQSGTKQAFLNNVHMEMQRNQERYACLRWAQQAFNNFRVVPPGTGICHQVNLEYLAKTVWTQTIEGQLFAYPDTLVGTDSHTTMINSLGVLGWGVGGIEAEAAMLGQPISMLIPEVIGYKLTGQLAEGITATDLVLTITEMLRAHGVVGKFVEFYGPGLDELPLADRATIANMAPEYGATCGFFPIDQATLDYLQLSGREQQDIDLVKAYSQIQGLWRDSNTADPKFTASLSLDLSTVQACLAGPKRPQDRATLSAVPHIFKQELQQAQREQEAQTNYSTSADYDLHHGDVVIAAITSCTNTSNPSVMLAAGLLAQKALAHGLQKKPWVKSSLAPGSKVVTDYLAKTGLQHSLDQLGFNLVGYGCTTCIGNSGPLAEPVATTIQEHDLHMCAVLSGNRNFEGRVHPQVKANWLASPPLVVAYALAGTTCIDLSTDPIAHNDAGKAIYLKDIWPSNKEVAAAVAQVNNTMFKKEYANVFKGDSAWQAIEANNSPTYQWQADSSYIKSPPFFKDLKEKISTRNDIQQARILALLGDSITTDHISPAGSIKVDSPAGRYLMEQGIKPLAFNSYGARRGNHEVMMRGTFANIRIRNEMVANIEGGFTRHIPTQEVLSIYDAAMRYQQEQTPLVIIAGKEYGTGSSRDWAAKGTLLLGVHAVIAESFERIHRSNLIGVGVLPLQFETGVNRKSLQLTGEEQINIVGIQSLQAKAKLQLQITRTDGSVNHCHVHCRIDTQNELHYYQQGGILAYVLRTLMK